ncbi:Serine/threonine-protein kinase spk-1 [Paramyrothecium foliicola]|nr:Serine/threonine-protein kinase spk-1 [Paramyrothecium foliicola]
MDDDESFHSNDSLRFLAPQVGDCEEVEFYEKGGYHPVHIGDRYDDDRYHVIHKLGSGGFSTVWLARDSLLSSWVALKFVVAYKSAAIEEKVLMCHKIVSGLKDHRFVTYQRLFRVEGPNGRHLCLVLPFLGPSTYHLSQFLKSRIHPWLVRRVISQTAKAVSDLHARGLCHGDITPSNIVFRMRNLDHLDMQGIYRLFGKPKWALLETCSGETHGPEAPRYIVGYLDFMSCEEDLFEDEVCLIDFDQSFLTSHPPKEVLGTPVGFLAPEVAVGRPASPASDVWALTCALLHIRSGSSPFSFLGLDAPCDLVGLVIQSLGNIPEAWGQPLYDERGRPTQDPSKGEPLYELPPDKVVLKEWIGKIFDRPPNFKDIQVTPATARREDNIPYPDCYEKKFWRPAALKVDSHYLSGYSDDVDLILESLPKISSEEAALLYDLVSKVFVYEPERRPSAIQLLDHPWFHLNNQY